MYLKIMYRLNNNCDKCQYWKLWQLQRLPFCHWVRCRDTFSQYYYDVIMGAITSQITSLTIVYSTVYSGADQRKHQSSASLAFVWVIHRWPVSPHKWPVTRKLFPLDDVIMNTRNQLSKPKWLKKSVIFSNINNSFNDILTSLRNINNQWRNR